MFARHDLAWLGGSGWEQALAGAPAEHAAAMAAWRQADRPLVVRRADVDQAPGQVALGLALPPRPEDGRKVRIPCRVAVEQVARRAAPLPLAQALAQSPYKPPRWDAALAALASSAADEGIELRVYGSLALQVLTGQVYLTASSDIDLLVQPRDTAGLDAALALLNTHAAGLPLDGEIVFPGGRAVAWKEWNAARAGAPGSRVLVKEMTRVSLATTDNLLAALEEQACTH